MGAVVDDLVTDPSPVVLQEVLELESGVVGTNVNTHGRIVPHANSDGQPAGRTDVRAAPTLA